MPKKRVQQVLGLALDNSPRPPSAYIHDGHTVFRWRKNSGWTKKSMCEFCLNAVTALSKGVAV